MGWDIDDSLPLPLMVGATSILLADWRHLNPYVRSRWPRYVIASNMLRRLRKAYERATTSLNAAAPAAARRSRPENSSSISESITTDLEWEIGSDTETTPTKIIIRLPLPIEDARRAISLLRPFNLKSFAASSTRDNTTATATATAILDDLAQYLQGTTDSQAARLEVELVDDPKPCPICGESWVEDQFGRANHS
ncbi:hypothetical protein I317_06028 [Kwoniella heveanensis CBS 569]|nr:hypothetical protein I317_06028 [Kwoniella heveanensis CBS 569]